MSIFFRLIVALSLLGATCSQASYTDDTKKIVEYFNQTSLETKNAEKIYTDGPEIFLEDSNETSLETENAKKNYTDDPNKFDFNETSSSTKMAEKMISKIQCKIQNPSNMLKVQYDFFKQCISLHINVSELKTELEDSRKTGSMNMVLKEKCGKWPVIFKCVNNAKLLMKRCLTFSDEKLFNQTIDIVKGLQEFLCFSNNGDRLARFVAGGGVTCFQEQYQGIKTCFNETVHSEFPQTGDFLTTALSVLLFTSRACKDFHKTRHCINEVLEKCLNTTTAYIVDASFRFIKIQISCQFDLELLEIVWYFFALYVILMYVYFYLIIKQKFVVTSLETPPTI